MPPVNPPSWLQSGSIPANLDRLLLSSLVNVQGILEANDLLVTEDDTPDGMRVKVAAGQAYILGTRAGDQGIYHVYNDGAVVKTLAASDVSNARIDRIIARVKDDFYDLALDGTWDIEVVTGAPSATPVLPDLPDDCIELARVDVGAGVSAITNAVITDVRVQAKGRRPLFQDGLREVLVFTSSGTFSKANYPWLRAVRAKVQAAGGAGGGATTTGSGLVSAGSGGGGGEYREGLIDVSALSASETITVGAGGASAAGANGGNGGASSFGSHITAAGGSGGPVRSAEFPPTNTQGGIQGSGGTGGDFAINGQPGHPMQALTTSRVQEGNGGASHLGNGGRGTVTNSSSAGEFGVQGGGGGGAGNSENQATAQPGGNGGDGIIILELYG